MFDLETVVRHLTETQKESRLARPQNALSLRAMQDKDRFEGQSVGESGSCLGFVRVVVAGKAFDLAVQALSFTKDGGGVAGGFFEKDGELGILLDDSVGPREAKRQIERGTQEAVRHLSRRVLN